MTSDLAKSDLARQYLLEYLTEEFRSHPEIRIRVLPFSRPEDDGVTVRGEAREYFFPTHWAEDSSDSMNRVEAEVKRIRDALEGYSPF